VWSRVRALLLRRVYRPLWPVLCGPLRKPSCRFTWDEGVLAQAGFPHQVSYYSCPIINPPAQRHVLENKLSNLGWLSRACKASCCSRGKPFHSGVVFGRPDATHGLSRSVHLHQPAGGAGSGGRALSAVRDALQRGPVGRLPRPPAASSPVIDAYGEGRYIPLGRDATVDYPKKDLCFQNPHRYPLALLLALAPTKTSGAFYAPQARDFVVEILVFSSRGTPITGSTRCSTPHCRPAGGRPNRGWTARRQQRGG